MVIVDYFKTHERIADSAVLCFDGVMIPKNSDTIDLEAVQNVVKEQTSYSITLKVKPMDEGYMITKDIPEYNDIKAFDPDDSFTWLDFIEKYHGATFTSEENLLNSTIHDLSRVYAWVHEGSGYHIRKTDCEDKIFDMMDGCRKIPKLFFKIQPPDPKAKMKKITFDQYVTEFLLSLNTYQSISFDPSCSNDRMFNLWTGYKAKESESPDFEGISLILKHLREVYCSDNTEAYEYFLTLLHTMLKYPNQRLGVATFLFSRTQGTGKNTFLDFLRDYVVGKQMTFECAGLDNVIKKFNSALKNKKLVVVDEIASSSETWHSNFDKMKTLITSESIQIEKKGVDMFAIKNLACYFFLSNNPDAIRLESSDRRYFCLEVSDKYVNNTKYFKDLRATFTQPNGDLFYRYILDWGIKNNLNERSHLKIPKTQFKKEIIQQSASSSNLFLDHLVEAIDELKEREFSGVDEDGKINATNLYQEYERWCNFNGEKTKKQRKFFLDIKGRIEKTRTKACIIYDLTTIQ